MCCGRDNMLAIYIIASIWITNFFICIDGMYVFSNKCMIERPVCKKKVSANETAFYLFTPQNKQRPEALHKCDLQLPEDTYFNSSNPTVLFITGYFTNVCILGSTREMKDELLKRQDYNVILVDWGYYSIGDYTNAAHTIRHPVDDAVTLIKNIKKQTRISYKSIHIIGHSLGAQIAGLVGQATKVFRITGLDPAGPGFYDKPANEKLDRYDADFVDVIHTNAGRCLPPFGYKYPIGDEDFYVEGGTFQVSCYNMVIESILKFDALFAITIGLLPTSCSHVQSVHYFKSTINAENNCCFLGKRCLSYKDAMRRKGNCVTKCGSNLKNCSIMGMDWPLTYQRKLPQQRVYAVEAEKTCPYCSCDLETSI